MKVTYKDRSTIEAEKLVPVGDYHFHVEKAEELTSQFNNKKYINLTLKLSSPNVKDRFEWVKMYEDDSAKWLDFCETVGIVDALKSEDVTVSDCLQKSGSLKITRIEAKGEYKARNQITFLPNKIAPKGNPDLVESDVPF